jgi:rhomboid family GlyGly-CTERM serine protease
MTRQPMPIACLLLAVFAVAAYAIPGAAEWLQFGRDTVAGWQLWRVVTCHFAHWSGDHLFWDVLVFVALGWLCERKNAGSFLRSVGLSGLLIPIALWFALPQMATYRGLSGIDSALFGLVAARFARVAAVDKNWGKLTLVAVVAVGFLAKVSFELLTGTTLFVASASAGLVPVPLAHVVGVLVGAGCGLTGDVTAASLICKNLPADLPAKSLSCRGRAELFRG